MAALAGAAGGGGEPGADELAVPALFNSAAERRKYDDLADFFSIIKATEHLERAYMKDAIEEDEYTRECSKLIGHFKNLERQLLSATIITSTDAFIAQYRMDARMARECLLERGCPITTLFPGARPAADSGAAIAETTTALITAVDALQLDYGSMDDLHPLLSDVSKSINKVPYLPAGFPGLDKLQQWLAKLNDMRAAERLDDDEVRQLKFDLESLYKSFMDWLKKKGHKST